MFGLVFSWLRLIFIVVFVVPATLLIGWLLWAHFIQSPLYAGRYFTEVVDVTGVLESRRWQWGDHPWAHEALGCTYAIAALPDSASIEPPLEWTNNWQETPINSSHGQYNILNACDYLWPDDLVDRLAKAQEQPGSYYVLGPETLLLYSQSQRVVARIRFGD